MAGFDTPGLAARPAALPLCRHCGRCPAHRPRGLCWGCYYAPGVKELYPSTSKYARRGYSKYTGPATHPTAAPPGTYEKLVVLMLRASLGQDLFHPDDAGSLEGCEGGRFTVLPEPGYAWHVEKKPGRVGPHKAAAARPVARVG